MDPQFEELARHIADDVEKRFSKRFDEAETRLEGVLVRRLHDAEGGLAQTFADAETRLSSQFADAETRLTTQFADAETRLSTQFAEAETRLSTQFADAEKRLSDGARMHMEELKTTVTVVAEGYGATLDRIERQLTELNTKFDTKFSDHDKLFENHAARIAALEQSKVR